MGALTTVALVAATDLRRRARNRSALIMAFAGPLAMALVFGALLGGTRDVRVTIGVVDLDRTPTSEAIAAGLVAGAVANERPAQGERERGAVDFVGYADRASAQHAVDSGDIGAALVFNTGFAAAPSTGAVPELVVLRRADRLVSGQVAQSVALSVASHFDTVLLAANLAAQQSGGPPPAAVLATAEGLSPPVQLTQRALGAREVSAAAYFGASMSILFLFFTVGAAARSTLAESREGTLARVLATPARPAAVIAGKTLSVAVLALAGMATVWAATSVVFGANWGTPLAVWALMAATVLAISGTATLVTSLARTERQADAASAAVTFAFALLGGNFTGPGQGPTALRALSLLTPNGWALRGFTDLSADAATIGSIGLNLAVLCAIALVAGSVGLVRVHRAICR